MKSENPLKAAVSVSAQCRLLKMSRSQFYWHVQRGTFHAPLKLPNGRPYFTASMVEDNLRARESGVTVSGEYVIFYERQPTSTKIEIKKFKNDLTALLEGLKALGLSTVAKDQVESALATCFPEGTNGHDDNVVLKRVFRQLKSSGNRLNCVRGPDGDSCERVRHRSVFGRILAENRPEPVVMLLEMCK